MVDHFLDSACGQLTRVMVFDSEGCNLLVRRVLTGCVDEALKRRVKGLSFFGRVGHRPFAGLESWPRVPIRRCYVDDEEIFVLPGRSLQQECLWAIDCRIQDSVLRPVFL
jgi:hypothetical protein